MERICAGAIPSKVDSDIVIADLPPEYKDPADFVAARGGKAFRSEVLANTTRWTDWYLRRLVNRYSPGSRSDGGGKDSVSFARTCECVADFLASPAFPNPADRTRRAYGAAGMLATPSTSRSGLPRQYQREHPPLPMAVE